MSDNFFDVVNELSKDYKESLDSDNPTQLGHDIEAPAMIFAAVKDLLPPQEQGLNIGDSCLFYEMGIILECLILERAIDGDRESFFLRYKLKVTKAPMDGLYAVDDIFEVGRKLGENDRMLNMILWSIIQIPKT